jgi:hypothetical protein
MGQVWPTCTPTPAYAPLPAERTDPGHGKDHRVVANVKDEE